MQFIIKNCPACRNYDVFGRDNEGCCYLQMKYCKDVDNCLMKQVVKKCRQQDTEDAWVRVRHFAQEILSMLELQECENE